MTDDVPPWGLLTTEIRPAIVSNAGTLTLPQFRGFLERGVGIDHPELEHPVGRHLIRPVLVHGDDAAVEVVIHVAVAVDLVIEVDGPLVDWVSGFRIGRHLLKPPGPGHLLVRRRDGNCGRLDTHENLRRGSLAV